ncbi:MAG: hypothetical protein R2705_07425 [Ilumatobacteraceae bacterium]
MSSLRIATRGSAQARTQSESVAAALRAAHPGLTVELVLIETTGDQRQDVPLHEIGGQGVFVREVQRAVLDGRADLAVHSAKDLPSWTAEGLRLTCVTERRDPRDALIGASSTNSRRCHRGHRVSPPSSSAPSCAPTSPSSSCAATSGPDSTRSPTVRS